MALGWASMFNDSGRASCHDVRADDDLTIARLSGDICDRDLDNHLETCTLLQAHSTYV